MTTPPPTDPMRCAKCGITVVGGVSPSANANEVYHEECFPYPPTNPNAETVKLLPPNGYNSWLEYAICTMETRDLFNESCCNDSRWGRTVQRYEMRDAAKAELAACRHESDELKRLREALQLIADYGWPFPKFDQAAKWCAEQARAALKGEST